MLFLSHTTNWNLCNYQSQAGKRFHVAVISDTINVVNVKLCMMVTKH